MIKVFLSHQRADSMVASRIADRLKRYHSIESYLDVIDPYVKANGEDLAAHIRKEMTNCTQLLAVISDSTIASQWVPWEIGVATEKNYPLATYSQGYARPPEFLQKWPYLRSDADIDEYAKASKRAASTYQVRKSASFSDASAQVSSTAEFFKSLRAGLGQ
ncbi:toll/interleukin-1 receptor domain-containing protein [Rhizobium wenxiniae]|uniref:toll/interleukin-1 receptor domain-containing protein n=1 Tax=Rhizobium wenxiniae TaxID=1737357 RepID=UPI001C6EC6CF|nr:toll/interleukin-1 receptor domain-containing protein [Rhizobium wenxiniae]MBW9090814.1 toll/interleukin-1 receptor domain-containing protein [Rhizobium wenxiniae]